MAKRTRSNACRRGHLLEGENVALVTSNGKRWCQTCQDARKSTHCGRGHPWTGDNLRINAAGKRFCRACVRINASRRYKSPQGRQYNREHAKRYRKRRREVHLRRMYGISQAEFDAMASRQGGQCAACGIQPSEGLVVDHDHDTGAVRELLCQRCNKVLGLIRDDPELAQQLITYLRRHQESNLGRGRP
jgi:Zn finger protein HypA/HybF involved in hydrogenase expression